MEQFERRPDLLGRTFGRRLPMTTYIDLMMRSKPERVREVPRAAIEEDGHDDDGPFAMVKCPCGHQPIAHYCIEKCSGCQRYYLTFGPKVFVIYGDMEPPALPPVDNP